MDLSSNNPVRIAEELREILMRRIETDWRFASEALSRERRALLGNGSALMTELQLEPIPRYGGTETGEQALRAAAGLSGHEARTLLEALFGVSADRVRLFSHQAAALTVALSREDRHNPVITSGTGSGKTESFLLPVLARLLREARTWRRPPAVPWWEQASGHWRPLRQASPDAAVRAVVLYPMNALVEDQIARLRRTLRRLRQMGGPEIWFGRYTSATPGGSGPLPSTSADRRVVDVGKSLRTLQQEFEDLAGLDPHVLGQFQDPRHDEMVTRWDMIAAAPDILVTNYSMLNVMLMRRLESPIFESTRRWLKKDPAHVFTLVVDELHLYRGTQGAEVALILRSLADRLGLEPDSPQFRVIATSASMDADRSTYLEQFFGLPLDSFARIPGEPLPVSASLPISATHLREAMNNAEVGIPLDQALAEACRSDDGALSPTPLGRLSRELFGSEDLDALAHVFEHLIRNASSGNITFRAHLFLRTIRGLWACCDPECTEVPDVGVADRPPIGRLWLRPRDFCGCGGRVLELLICGTCGDASLGGYVVGQLNDGYFLASTPGGETDNRARTRRELKAADYQWYRPGTPHPLQRTHADKRVTFSFVGGEIYPLLGYVQPGAGTSATFMTVASSEPDWSPTALPPACPACEQAEIQRGLIPNGVTRSPIKSSTQLAGQVTQLAVEELLRALSRDADRDPGTIVFTDSRDSASRTAVELNQSHYRDLVRQLVQQEVNRQDDLPATILKRGAEGSLSPRLRVRYDQLRSAHDNVDFAYRLVAAGRANDEDRAVLARFESDQQQSGRPWADIVSSISAKLVELGTPPGGVRPSLLTLASGEPWERVFAPPEAGEWVQFPLERRVETSRTSTESHLSFRSPKLCSTARAETSRRLMSESSDSETRPAFRSKCGMWSDPHCDCSFALSDGRRVAGSALDFLRHSRTIWHGSRLTARWRHLRSRAPCLAFWRRYLTRVK